MSCETPRACRLRAAVAAATVSTGLLLAACAPYYGGVYGAPYTAGYIASFAPWVPTYAIPAPMVMPVAAPMVAAAPVMAAPPMMAAAPVMAAPPVVASFAAPGPRVVTIP